LNTHTYEEALEASAEYFGNELSPSAFLNKYALRNEQNDLVELTPTDMHRRIAKELARIEKDKFQKPLTEEEIFSYLDKFDMLIPQGSPMYGIGNNHRYVSISNCFVVESPRDSYGGICKTDQEIVQISKRRGGVGVDLSTLRPTNSPTQNSSRSSTGTESWMQRFSNTIREVGQCGRRGALMETISVHHPDILTFATIKNDDKKVTGANISVRLSDEFLKSLDDKTDYELRWPVEDTIPEISKMESAKKVWDTIIDSAWNRAEPGLLFWDTILRESIPDCYEFFKSISTNPCAEIVLCAYDSCRLLAMNLFYCVENAFTKDVKFSFEKLKKMTALGQRLMDDIVDLEIEAVDKIINKIESDPEPDEIKQTELSLWQKIKEKAVRGRRTGLGITALGDAMAACGIKYGSEESVEFTEEVYKTIKLAAYGCSVDMAKELGPFPEWNHEKEKNNPFLLRIKDENPKLYADMVKYGRRNIAILTTAPTGTVSMMASLGDGYHGTTSGIEPLFSVDPYTRRKKGNPGDNDFRSDFVDQNGDHWMEFQVYHPGIVKWMEINNKKDLKGCPYVSAGKINWTNRVKIQAAAQRHVDHSISSTINLPNDVSKEQVKKIYLEAWKNGLKGITVYRDGCRTGVLINKKEEKDGIIKTDAPKRPVELECDVHHISVKGQAYFVLVGLMDGDPYEIFAGKNGVVDKKVKKGKIIKQKRSRYKAIFEDETELSPIGAFTSDEEDTLTRLISAALRHGTNVTFLVHQLEKAKGDLQSFAKSLLRALKKYIPDGEEVKGEECPDCYSSLVRSEGCLKCMSCGWSKC
jgi:ribonucleoside-diphosphate reductase alpha chain